MFVRINKLRRAKTARVSAFVLLMFLVFAAGVGADRLKLNPNHIKSENSQLPTTLDFSDVNQVYNLLKNDYDGNLNSSQLIQGLNKGLAQATGDPYTEYFTPDEAKQFNNAINNTFSGIGAELGQDAQNNIEIIAPIAGTPADKAGLRSKDVISAINSASTSGMSIDEAVNKIRGPANTNVTLSIVRGGSSSFNVTITRQNITPPSVNTKILGGNIGYMQITQFTNDTSDLAAKAAQQFKEAHVKGVVLDLRDNPGGIVDQAVNVSSLWLDKDKLIMQEKRGDSVLNTYVANGDNTLSGIPTVILVNSGTASAAEIVTGALHDNKAAQVIGEKTYGKGVVQEVDNLNDGSEIKITIAKWYRPNSQNINKQGINPDQTVTMSDSDYKNNLDPQRDAAVNYLNNH